MKYDKIKEEIKKIKKQGETGENTPVNLLEIIKAKREGKDVSSGIPVPDWLKKKILKKRKELEDWGKKNNNG